MRTIAFIPARGGSKRLPGKNTMLFAGRPLLWYSVRFAEQTEAVDRIIVSSDSPEIGRVAQECGAEWLERPSEIAGDRATTASAAQHFVESLRLDDADRLLTLQPTNPLRLSRYAEEAFATFDPSIHDSLMTVTPNGRKYGQLEDGLYRPSNYTLGQRGQDLSQSYYENGVLYLTTARLARTGELFGQRIAALPTPELFTSLDIDTKEEFELAECYYKRERATFDFD